MAPLDFNLLYIKSQFTVNMNALNTHEYSFTNFENEEEGAHAKLFH